MLLRPKIALEVPHANLDLGFQASDYIFALAHLWAESSVYRKAVTRWKSKGRQIYLDNSAFELGTSISTDEYVKIILEVKPDVVVVPDTKGNLAETLRLTKTFYTNIPNSFFARYRFMVVLQGQDNRERMKCFHTMRALGYPFQVVGFPRHAYPNRVELLWGVNKYLQRNAGKAYHFLGCPDIEELRDVSPMINSLDTSWVAKHSIGKDGFESLDFQKDILNEESFNKSLALLHEVLEAWRLEMKKKSIWRKWCKIEWEKKSIWLKWCEQSEL